MWQQEFIWFFTIFHHEFRPNNPIAFEVLMVLAVAHLFGFYNPKQLADFLEVPHQQFYTELKDWSVYHVTRLLYFGEYRMNYHLAMTGCCLVNKVVKRSTACCPSWSCSWA